MISGFYNIVFTGMAGSGFGLIMFREGVLVGADVTGATYDGSYSEDPSTGVVGIQATMFVPAGIALVQTGVRLAAPHSEAISASIAIQALSSGEPVLLEMVSGPVDLPPGKWT